MSAIAVSPNVPEIRSQTKWQDARRRKRLKVSLPVHVRPFDARLLNIEDVGEVIDFTNDGLFFHTCMPHYRAGMRLIMKFPFGESASAHRTFLGTVVRVAEKKAGQCGVAVRFLL